MAKIIQIQVATQVQWQAHQTDAGHWLGFCPALGMTMEGASLDELYAHVSDSVQLLLTDLLEEGELESFLRRKGWRAVSLQDEAQGNVRFEVPMQLLIESARRDTPHPRYQ